MGTVGIDFKLKTIDQHGLRLKLQVNIFDETFSFLELKFLFSRRYGIQQDKNVIALSQYHICVEHNASLLCTTLETDDPFNQLELG